MLVEWIACIKVFFFQWSWWWLWRQRWRSIPASPWEASGEVVASSERYYSSCGLSYRNTLSLSWWSISLYWYCCYHCNYIIFIIIRYDIMIVMMVLLRMMMLRMLMMTWSAPGYIINLRENPSNSPIPATSCRRKKTMRLSHVKSENWKILRRKNKFWHCASLRTAGEKNYEIVLSEKWKLKDPAKEKKVMTLFLVKNCRRKKLWDCSRWKVKIKISCEGQKSYDIVPC